MVEKVTLSNGKTKEFKSIVSAVNFALNFVEGKKKEAYTKVRDGNTTTYRSEKRHATIESI